MVLNNVFMDGFRQLMDSGFFEVVLPFILIFTIIFAVAQKAKLFGDASKKFNVLIAFAIGMIAVWQHYSYKGSQWDVISMLNQALPQVSFVIVAVVMLLLIWGLFGSKNQMGSNKFGGIVAIASIGIILWIFGSSAGFGLYDLPWWLSDPSTYSLVIAIIVFALVIGYITKDPKDPKPDPKDSFLAQVGEAVFGGKKE
jgi:hypothetical protein